MKKYLIIFIFALATLTGCKQVFTPVTEPKEVPVIRVGDLPDTISAPFLEAGLSPNTDIIVSDLPEEYLPLIDPTKVRRAVAQVPVPSGEVKLTPAAEGTISILKAFPGTQWLGELLGVSAMTVTMYYRKRAKDAERGKSIAETALWSFGENLDEFRDVLDITPGGSKFGDRVLEIFADPRRAPNEEVAKLKLDAFHKTETPTKTPIT